MPWAISGGQLHNDRRFSHQTVAKGVIAVGMGINQCCYLIAANAGCGLHGGEHVRGKHFVEQRIKSLIGYSLLPEASLLLSPRFFP